MNFKKLAVVAAVTLTLILGLMMLGGNKTRAAGPWYVNSTTGNDSFDCLSPITACKTITAAIGKATAGDTINVAAGTYNESVYVDKTLTLLGAQANIDARTRAGAESIIDSTCSPVGIGADNVVLNGFTVQGSTMSDPCLIAGIWTNPGFSGTQGGHQILNNIVQNNITGIELDNTGVFPTKVQFNVIRNNNNPGPGSGNAIQVNFGLNNALIDNNQFSGHTNSSVLVSSGGDDQKITISNNELVGGTFERIIFGSVEHSSITGNTIIGTTSSGAVRLFGGNNDITISCNLLSGNQRGIRVDDVGIAPNSNITANNNNIQGNVIAGLQVDAGGYSPGFLNAENNWWGSPTGPTNTNNPSGAGDKVIDPDGVVDFFPYLTSPSTCAPVLDLCPTDPNKTAPGQCGCGVPDTDTDHDGTADCNDLCPNDPNKIAPGVCGCGHPDTDTDHDGTPDCNDQCPNDPHKTVPGACGCGTPDTDSDHDGVPDCHDNCPTVPNPDQRDTNHDGIGDACTAFQFPSGGLFVVGDLVSLAGGSTVNFWGSQWAQNNPLTSGAAPNAFKGFEDGTTTLTCGGTWTSKPGNSSNPPATVPQFMGVIVSSSIQKNGSTISGNVKKIIVIQTNPGYGPAPGKVGTGKVIAIFCQ